MALFRLPPVVDALDDLLDRERQAILKGDLDRLVRLAPEKERLLGLLAGASADERRILRLRQKADRNQELLRAVARGIRAARQRITRSRASAQDFKTYDKGGRSQKLSQPGKGVEKRA